MRPSSFPSLSAYTTSPASADIPAAEALSVKSAPPVEFIPAALIELVNVLTPAILSSPVLCTKSASIAKVPLRFGTQT